VTAKLAAQSAAADCIHVIADGPALCIDCAAAVVATRDQVIAHLREEREAITANGKQQPIDAEPDPKGNLVLERKGAVTVARVADLFDKPGERFMPHHATCPNADDWRRR